MDNSGLIGRPPPICPNQPTIWGPKYKSWDFFIKLTPFQFGFCTISIKNSNCSIFRPIGRTPIFKNGPQYGASNTYERGLQLHCRSYIIQGGQGGQGAWNLPHKFHLYLIFLQISFNCSMNQSGRPLVYFYIGCTLYVNQIFHYVNSYLLEINYIEIKGLFGALILSLTTNIPPFKNTQFGPLV